MGFVLKKKGESELRAMKIRLAGGGIEVRSNVLKDEYLDKLQRYDSISFDVFDLNTDYRAGSVNISIWPVYLVDGTRYLRAHASANLWAYNNFGFRARSYKIEDIRSLQKVLDRLRITWACALFKYLATTGKPVVMTEFELVDEKTLGGK